MFDYINCGFQFDSVNIITKNFFLFLLAEGSQPFALNYSFQTQREDG